MKWIMVNNAKKHTGLVLADENDSRITAVGKFLRKTRIDEITQLINVLKGDMSFVGSRPPLFSQEDLVKNRKKYSIDEFKPGVTG